ncbi:hypothetical protein JI752_017905, partial [Lysobacter sp. MMG2]|uniref:DUF6708 domain-containing protein n=1 Tax=Lysobacter sp. MMG2 TaxID=2801338 RepID=UPI001C21A6DF
PLQPSPPASFTGRAFTRPLRNGTLAEHLYFRLTRKSEDATGVLYNDTVLELRCGMFEAWRGLVTLLSVTILWAFGLGLPAWAVEVTWAFITRGQVAVGTGFDRYPNAGDIYSMCFLYVVCGSVLWLYFKYGFRISRLEMLTSRHLLVRFNRKTRQVYLHRPKYCGGIVTLPWDGTIGENPSANATEASGIGTPLMLQWSPKNTGLPHMEMAFVGPQAQGSSELRNEWEFIRRFMEDGPDGLPKPHITSHFPWPWQAFTAQFEGVSRFFANASPAMQWGLILISPAFLALGTAHWLSLLLCWKPRWPKVIREAGLPGKPTPPLTTLADYPPDIQQRLLANADQWALKPGSRPEREPRSSRPKKRSDAATQVAPHPTSPSRSDEDERKGTQ